MMFKKGDWVRVLRPYVGMHDLSGKVGQVISDQVKWSVRVQMRESKEVYSFLWRRLEHLNDLELIALEVT